MTDTTTRCPARNGTYACELDAHDEQTKHRKQTRSRGRVVVATWQWPYGPVKFVTPRA